MGVLMIDLKQSVQYIKGVGPSRAKLLSLLGVNTVEDLINYYFDLSSENIYPSQAMKSTAPVQHQKIERHIHEHA